MAIKTKLLLAIIIGMYLINGVMHLRAISITNDEASFYNYAKRLIKGHPERRYPDVDNSKMPVSVLNLLPRMAEQALHPGLQKNDLGQSDLMHGRYITLLVSMFILLLVYKWSAALYGETAGLFSAFLTSFSPNLLANSVLITTDSYSALALLASMYVLWRYCSRHSLKNFVLLAVCVGISQLVKQSLFYLYVLVPATLFIYYRVQDIPIKWRALVTYTVAFLFINWLIINAGFYFRQTNTLLGNFTFMSDTFKQLQHRLPGWLPLPFPNAFVTGLDQAKYYNQVGGGYIDRSSFGNVTILGKSSTGGSFWYYYFVSVFFKTPVSNLIFIAASIWAMVKRNSFRVFTRQEFFLLLPVLFYLLYMSFLYNTQCGIRQLIFIYPFLFILCGILIPLLNTRYTQLAVAVLSIVMLTGVTKYWSNYYPYTNELIINKTNAYRFVGASNLEFGQGEYFFAKYLRTHPGVKRISAVPEPGTFLMTSSEYLDTWNLHTFAWANGIKPTGQVAYNGLLITVTEADLQKIQRK